MNNNIKALRVRKGISQAELARRLKVSRSWIARLESGEKKPSVSMSLQIANQLDCTLDDIFLS